MSDRLTAADICDLSRWASVLLWGGIVLEGIARAPIEFSLLQAVQLDGAALEALQRHNDWIETHREAHA